MIAEDIRWFIMVAGALVIHSVVLTRWINQALHRLDTKVQEERIARAEYFDRKIEEVKRMYSDSSTRHYALRNDFNALELRLEQKMNGYPTKVDIKDMLAPVVSMVETIHEELLHRGIHTGSPMLRGVHHE